MAGVVLAWLAMRVWILRNRLALRAPGEEPPKAPRWLLALARSRYTMPVLLGIGVCILLLALVA